MSIASAISEREEKSDALRRAVLSGTSDEVTRVLINGGMEPEGIGLWGVSPLFHAAEHGRNVVVGLLLASGADVDRRCGRLHATALHVASECGHVEVVLRLLAAGADPTKINRDYQTPLHAAVFNGSVKVVARLLDAGANLNARNLHGDTPLSLAVAHDDIDVVTLLLFAGADPSAEGINGYSPLHEAAEAGNAETLVELLIAGAHPSVWHRNTGETPLFLAAGEGNVDVVNILIRWGADAMVQTFEGLTPLDIAAKNGHSAVMRELFQSGVVMESVTGRELTYNPLPLAGARALEGEVSLLNPAVHPRQAPPRSGDGPSRPSALVAMPLEEASTGSHTEFTAQPRGAKWMALEGGYHSSVAGDDRSSLYFSSEDASTSGDVHGCSEREDRLQRRMLEGRTVWPLRSPAKSRSVKKAGRLHTLDCESRACVQDNIAVQPFSDGGTPSISSVEEVGNNFLGCWKPPVWDRTAAAPASTGAMPISNQTRNRGEYIGNDWKVSMRQNLARELPPTLEEATARPKARTAARPADHGIYAVEYDSEAHSRAGGSLFSSVGSSLGDLSQGGSSYAPDACRRVRFCVDEDSVLDDTVDASSSDERVVQGMDSGRFAEVPTHGLWPMSPAEPGDKEFVPREYNVGFEMEVCSSENTSKASDQPRGKDNGAQSGAGLPKCVDARQRNDEKRKRGWARLVTFFSGRSTTTLKQESSLGKGKSKSALSPKCSREPTSPYRGRLPGYKTFSSLLRPKRAVRNKE